MATGPLPRSTIHVNRNFDFPKIPSNLQNKSRTAGMPFHEIRKKFAESLEFVQCTVFRQGLSEIRSASLKRKNLRSARETVSFVGQSRKRG